MELRHRGQTTAPRPTAATEPPADPEEAWGSAFGLQECTSTSSGVVVPPGTAQTDDAK